MEAKPMTNEELDAMVPDDWREHVRALRQENASRRRENEALRARVAELQAEPAAVAYAGRMPGEYGHGLPAWVNYMYITWQGLLAPDGRPIRRSEDIEKMIADAKRITELEAERNEWKAKAQEIHGEDIALRERLANAEADKIGLEAEVARLVAENEPLLAEHETVGAECIREGGPRIAEIWNAHLNAGRRLKEPRKEEKP